MADERVRAAVENWAPRFVADGVDFNVFQLTTASIETWDQWCEAWCKVGQEFEALAAEEARRNQLISASEHYLAASMAYHFSKFLWFVDLDRYRESHRKTVECYTKAMKHFAFPAERVEIPFEGIRMPGYLRKPDDKPQPPVVIMIPGLDSTKEELHFYANHFLRRGLATLAIDGPGQGETEFKMPMRPDWEKPIAAVLDFLQARKDVNAEAIGVWGVSMGGYYAPRAAAFNKRIKACVGLAGFYKLSNNWNRLPILTREGFCFRSRAKDEGEAREIAEGFSLEGIAERITCPLLMIHGKRDRLFPPEEPERIVKEAQGPKEFVLFEDGAHVCNNIIWKYRPLMADWIAEQLAA